MTTQRLLLLLALLLASCQEAPPSRAQTTAGADTDAEHATGTDTDAEALARAYDRLRAGRFTGDQAAYAIDVVEEHYLATSEAAALDSLLRFAERHPRHGHWALADVAAFRYGGLGAWLRSNAQTLTGQSWSWLAGAVAVTCGEAAGCWREPVVVQLLIDRALDPQTEPSERADHVYAFADFATLAEADHLLSQTCAQPIDGKLRMACAALRTRYATEVHTERLRTLIAESQQEPVLWALSTLGLVPYGRHDLLPELEALWDRAQSESAFGGDAAELRGWLSKAIAALEAAKAAGVAPGLPLDWPATPDDYEAPR